MIKKILLLACLSTLLSAGTMDLPPAESWKKLGDGTRLETEGNIWRIQPGTGRENGIWSSHALTLSRAKYRVSFRYRLGGGVLHFIVKHGDNTYSLLEKRLPATGGEWKEFQAEMTEDRPGTHGSLWFLCTRPVEVTELNFERIPSEAEAALKRRLAPAPVEQREPETPETVPDLRDTFLIAQEWHSWFYTDTTEKGGDAFFRVWGYQDGRSEYRNSSGPLWRRAGADLTYPYLGFYSAGNTEVICWQLRCMKNSRLDGVLMQLYPDPESGRKFLNLEHFENCLKLARQEGFRLGIHDEIQFMPKSAKEISAFIERASSVLALAGKYPEAFLRRNGKILYQYEAWNLPYSAAEHQQIMEAVERKSGEKIYWMVSGPAEKMVQVEALGCLKLPANTWSHCRKETTRAYGTGGDRWEADSELPDDTLYWDKWRESLRKSRQLVAEANRKRKNKLEQAVWIYPGFNNAGRWSKLPEVMPDRSFDRDAFFLKAIRIAQQEVAPAIVNLSSWNDREEKTALEPSWSNENADPFASVRLLAKMKGARFTEPPLPPKEYVDPWMWSILYGIDRTPPRITGLRLHVSEANMAVDAVDDLSGVDRIEVSAAPTAYVKLDGGEAAAFDCTFGAGADGTLKQDRFLPFTLTLPARPEGYGPLFLGIKYRAPEGAKITAVLRYPRNTEYGIFRSNGEKASSIPAGPVLHGMGASRWHAVKLHNFRSKPGSSGKIEIHLKLSGGEEAALEQLALYPEAIANETSRGFALPAAGKEFRTFVVGFPDKLLPRNFTGIPFALQAVDAEGNRSRIQFFDLTQEDMSFSLGGRSVECDGYFWR